MWLIDECVVIGGAQSIDEPSPFDRAAPVLERRLDRGRSLIARRWRSSPECGWTAEGDVLTPEEWDGLVDGDEAFILPEPIALPRPGTLWLFGPAFLLERNPALTELAATHALLGGPWDIGHVRVALVDDAAASVLRDRWNENAYDRAIEALRIGDLKSCLRLAEIAFHLDRGLTERRVALLAAAYRGLGQHDVAASYLDLARNSRGDEFHRRVMESFKELEAPIGVARHRPRRLQLLRRERRAHLADAENQLKATKPAPKAA